MRKMLGVITGKMKTERRTNILKKKSKFRQMTLDKGREVNIHRIFCLGISSFIDCNWFDMHVLPYYKIISLYC